MDEQLRSMVAKAAATVSRDKFLRPLRALCVRKVALSLKFYVDRGVTSLHSHLLPKLCEEVFESFQQQMSHERENSLEFLDKHCLIYYNFSTPKMLEVASLFVGAGLKHFCTPVVYPQQSGDFTEAWKMFLQKLAEGAPKLASFEFDRESYGPAICMLPSLFIDFVKMPQLITLKISSELTFTDADLQVIGSSLPLLRHLKIRLSKDVTTEGGLCHLQQLKMLEHFVFSNELPGPYSEVSKEEIMKKRLEFCLQRMPKLKISGFKMADYIYCETEFHSFTIFEQIEEPVVLGLEHLLLKNNIPPTKVLLPHVTQLQIQGSKALNFCLGRSFLKLKTLYVIGVSLKNLEKLLLHLGHPVTTLHLFLIKSPCDLLMVLSCCPQLESLNFSDDTRIQATNFINPSVSRLLAKLKIFYYAGDNLYAPGLLKLLMSSCPDLEELTLDVSLPKEEVDEVAAGIAAGAFLCIPKIKKLRLEIDPLLVTQESLDDFVHQVVVHFPKLALLSVYEYPAEAKFYDNFVPLKTMLRKLERGHVLNFP